LGGVVYKRSRKKGGLAKKKDAFSATRPRTEPAKPKRALGGKEDLGGEGGRRDLPRQSRKVRELPTAARKKRPPEEWRESR